MQDALAEMVILDVLDKRLFLFAADVDIHDSMAVMKPFGKLMMLQLGADYGRNTKSNHFVVNIFCYLIAALSVFMSLSPLPERQTITV